MSLYLDERSDGGFALYIDGDFQFDTTDEALYHESMALPALCLAQPSQALRVLICGGGDGLALRECLRYPGVAHADLVDYDPQVVDLGRTRFAEINRHAFEDPRVNVHIADAWEFLQGAAPYDVILCDFTVPRRHEDTRIFSREWYERLQGVLSPGGMIGLNAVSPQITPEAFWCLRKTVRASGLSALPYHVCIPSFRDHGYGAWAFLLAAPQPLSRSMLRDLRSPVPTQQADLTKLWRGARFRRAERKIEKCVPVNTLANGCLLPLLLNPGSLGADAINSALTASEGPSPYDLNPLLRSIPITHPYHTRIMVETLAQQVVGTVRELDIRRLLDALLRRAAALPGDLLLELGKLRDFLRDYTPRFEIFSAWSYRLFTCLVIMMTLANAIAPDNAFAKGGEGGGHGGSVGHSSFGGSAGSEGGGRSSGGSFGGSRGSSGGDSGGGRSGSFGGASGSSSSGRNGSSFGSRSSSGSFGREGGFGSRGIYSSASGPRFTGSGFRSSYGRGQVVDIYGVSEPSPTFFYGGYHGYYGPYTAYPQGNGGTRSNAPAEQHKALFLASDDMLVLDNGDVVVTVSDTAYLLLSNGTIALMSKAAPEPLMMLYADPNLFQNVVAQLDGQHIAALQAIQARRDWLSWVGWTSALVSTVAGDRVEMNNLEDLSRRLETAYQRLGTPPQGAQSAALQSGQLEMFIGCALQQDGTIALRGADGGWISTDGREITTPGADGATKKLCPPQLRSALNSVLKKMQKDIVADIASDNHDLEQLASDLHSLKSDQTEYQTLQASYGSYYDVEYGTDEIPVSDALDKTQRDLDQNAADTKATQTEIDQFQANQQRVEAAIQQYQP